MRITDTHRYVVDEKSVRYAYDSIFGEGTYKSGQEIHNECNNSFKYNKDYNYYELSEMGGCSNPSMVIVDDMVLKAQKNNNSLKIIVGVVFRNIGSRLFYISLDDANRQTNEIEKYENVIGNETDYQVVDKKIDKYISANADKLQQYTYTFEMDKNGFYKYVGFERTNE